MTNEELAVRIQQGERELLPELWEQVERFVKKMAGRQLRKLPETAAVEFDDLFNAGYIAFVRAVDSFEVDRDCVLLTLLGFTLKTAFAEATNYRSKKQQRDPLRRAVSFETLLPDSDSVTLEDTIPDASAEAAYEDADKKMFLVQLRKALDAALGHLSERQRDLLIQRYYNGETPQSLAEQHRVTRQCIDQIERAALRILRRPGYGLQVFAYPDIERRVNERTNFFYHVSKDQFNSTGSSAVEEMTLRREEWRLREDREDLKSARDLRRDIEKTLKDRPDLIDELINRPNRCG